MARIAYATWGRRIAVQARQSVDNVIVSALAGIRDMAHRPMCDDAIVQNMASPNIVANEYTTKV
ncbi:hypothetical protein A6U89_21690 [Agrobacterium sp. B133/95]|nr:hypothetical protein A6U89_21690 [Agrobacterium sp. B133/95]